MRRKREDRGREGMRGGGEGKKGGRERGGGEGMRVSNIREGGKLSGELVTGGIACGTQHSRSVRDVFIADHQSECCMI